MAFFLPEGFKDCTMSQVNCLEKNCTGLPVGSKSTTPMPEKILSEDGSYDASVWRNHTLFEVGRSSRGLPNSKSLRCNRKDLCKSKAGSGQRIGLSQVTYPASWTSCRHSGTFFLPWVHGCAKGAAVMSCCHAMPSLPSELPSYL